MIDYGFGVFLGPLRQDNLGEYYADRNDSAIWQWCRQNDLLKIGDHIEWFNRVTKDCPKIKMYEIVEPETFNYLGVCGLTDIDMTNSRAEFSLYISRDKQRKGYAEAALKTLFCHGFMNLNLNQIWGETFDENPAIDLFKKIGMHYDGTRREFYFRQGRYIDCHILSLLRSDFDSVGPNWDKKRKGMSSLHIVKPQAS